MPRVPEGLAKTGVLADKVTVATWNIGYAGLGKGSDFVSDGGTHLFPPSRKAVRANLNGILKTLEMIDSDVLFFQEVSDRSPLSYWVPVHDVLIKSIGEKASFYRKDIATRFLPRPLKIDHRTVLALEANPSSVEIVPLPLEPGRVMGFIKRRYGMQVARVPMKNGGEWVFINVHLSAFDDAGNVRLAQLKVVLDFVQAEFAKGRHVIVGGDWNMVLAQPDRPHTTQDKDLFWLKEFPREMLCEGWTIGADPEVPSVRTNYQPYVPGENFTTSIDGFLVSPNVRVTSVTTIDTGFEHTDHMPVIGTFERADKSF
jgi:endonuclease/exonuclease/phosphatase family metal-dependent hydrolase